MQRARAEQHEYRATVFKRFIEQHILRYEHLLKSDHTNGTEWILQSIERDISIIERHILTEDFGDFSPGMAYEFELPTEPPL